MHNRGTLMCKLYHSEQDAIRGKMRGQWSNTPV